MCSFLSGRNELVRHTTRNTHIKNSEQVDSTLKQRSLLSGFTSGKSKKVSTSLEMRLCALIAEANLPFNVVDKLVPILKKEVDHPVIQGLHLGRQKAANVIREGKNFLTLHNYIVSMTN